MPKMAALTTPHDRVLTVLFAERENQALQQAEAFPGSPGSLPARANETRARLWVHRY